MGRNGKGDIQHMPQLSLQMTGENLISIHDTERTSVVSNIFISKNSSFQHARKLARIGTSKRISHDHDGFRQRAGEFWALLIRGESRSGSLAGPGAVTTVSALYLIGVWG